MDGVAELVAQGIWQQQENGLPTTFEDARWQLRDLYLNFVNDQVCEGGAPRGPGQLRDSLLSNRRPRWRHRCIWLPVPATARWRRCCATPPSCQLTNTAALFVTTAPSAWQPRHARYGGRKKVETGGGLLLILPPPASFSFLCPFFIIYFFLFCRWPWTPVPTSRRRIARRCCRHSRAAGMCLLWLVAARKARTNWTRDGCRATAARGYRLSGAPRLLVTTMPSLPRGPCRSAA